MNSNSTQKCEVCGKDFDLEEVYVEHVLYEIHGTCSHCNLYSYDYAYGCFVVFVDSEGFTWHKSQSEEYKGSVKSMIAKAAERARIKEGF